MLTNALDAETPAPIDWSSFYRPLHAFVMARVRVAADADDLVQRVLERAMEHSSAEIESASGWLFAIARNAIADHYRAQARALTTHADALEAETVRSDSGGDRLEVIACMEPLLAALPADTARLLRWADMEGRSMQSIADELAITLTAAKSRVQRARKDFVQVTRECCAITRDARGRVTELTPRTRVSAIACSPATDCCATEEKKT